MVHIAKKHHRRSIRLPGYDYSQPGMYFVTICVEEKRCLFGEIVKGEMAVNEYGRIVREEWDKSAEIRHEIQLDEFAVMPNHVHGIVEIIEVGAHGRALVGATGRSLEQPNVVGAHGRALMRQACVGAHGRAPLQRHPRSLGSFVAGFKSATTTRINALRDAPGLLLWQRNYYEHVIRNEDDLHRIREYIQTNPLRWELDRENPVKQGEDEFDQWLDSLSRKKNRGRNESD